jgi:hypothetical protein
MCDVMCKYVYKYYSGGQQKALVFGFFDKKRNLMKSTPSSSVGNSKFNNGIST